MSNPYMGINHFKLSIEGDDIEAKAYATLAYFRLFVDSEGGVGRREIYG